MKKLIFIVLLIVGCDNSTEPEVQWVCKVKPDYDGPLPVELLESAQIQQQYIVHMKGVTPIV